jgi:hypothetical protein
MKQQILNLKKKLLIVELPEGAISVHLSEFYKNKISHYTKNSLHLIETRDNLLESNVKLIGKLTDITEDQFQNWVDFKEIFFSYLEKEGIYFENQLDKPIMEEYGYCEDRDTEGHFHKGYWEPEDGEEKWQESINEWQEAEEKVWKLENTYLFEII